MVYFIGTSGNDSQPGSAESDVMAGFAGNDTQTGGAGNDDIDGGAGNDDLYGGNGNDSLSGGDDNDWLEGGAGGDLLDGDAGNDTLFGGSGNDLLIGNTGLDSVFYLDYAEDYATTFLTGVLRVRGSTQYDGIDTIFSVESFWTRDLTAETSWFSKTASLTSQQQNSLIELYIASFNRAPDAIGLNYWGGRLHDGMTLQEIARSFFVQPETVAAYPSNMTTTAFVTEVYGNVLNRVPDNAGLNYWVGELDSGSVTKDIFLLAIINGANAVTGSAVDRETLANKVEVGKYFALTTGLNDTLWGLAVMSDVTSVDASVTAANNLTDDFASSIDSGVARFNHSDLVGLSQIDPVNSPVL